MLEFYDNLLLIAAVQGVFLSLALWVKNLGKKKQNYYFLILLGLISLVLIAKLNFNAAIYQSYPHFWFSLDTVAYLIGPFWYFSIQKSIRPKISLQTSDYLLLSPILFHVFFLAFISSLNSEELVNYSRDPQASWTFYGFCATVLFVNGSFLLKAQKRLKQYKDTHFPQLLLKGQYALLLVVLVWLCCFLLSFIVANVYLVNLRAYNFAFISLAFLLFALAFLALIKPASFYFLTQTFDSGETFVLQQIAEAVQQHLKEEQSFLKSSFSLNELSTAIDSNPVLTSKAINRILKSSFADLINEHRVRHFIQLARQEKMTSLTHWAIAEQSGFGNKVSFYKAFKKMMGTTPRKFLSMEEK